jgi:hypothetical protein
LTRPETQDQRAIACDGPAIRCVRMRADVCA